MSLEVALEFFERVADDAELQATIDAIAEPNEAREIAALLDMARAKGYEFTVDDYHLAVDILSQREALAAFY